jgi:hypothetical protein
MENLKQQRHKNYSITSEEVSVLLKSKVNKTLHSFEKVVKGVDKEVYKFDEVRKAEKTLKRLRNILSDFDSVSSMK